MKHNPWITKDTRQPTPEERLSNFKAQAAYHPELVNMIGNQFFKQLTKPKEGNDMTEYNNDNTGALFKNDKKESDKHPDYRGTITIAGVEYWQSAWISKSKSGATYMSQKFTPKDDAPKSAPAPVAADPFGDDLPF